MAGKGNRDKAGAGEGWMGVKEGGMEWSEALEDDLGLMKDLLMR